MYAEVDAVNLEVTEQLQNLFQKQAMDAHVVTEENLVLNVSYLNVKIVGTD